MKLPSELKTLPPAVTNTDAIASNTVAKTKINGCANDISRIPKLCVPGLAEAQRSRVRYEKYLAAVADTALPEPWEVVPKLVEFPPGRALPVATWIREDQLASFRDSAGS